MFRERELDLGAGTGSGVWVLGLVLGSGTMAKAGIGDEDGVRGVRTQLGTEPRGCTVSELGIRRGNTPSRR